LARSSQSLENVSGITTRQVYHNNLFTIYEIDSIKRTQ
jgi:hypothetical protein